MKDATTQHKDDNVWRVVLALICAVIIGYGFFYSKNTTSDLAFLIGYNLPATLLIWGAFYTTLARKRGRKIAGFSFLAIFISMIANGLIGYSQQKQEAKQALSEIKSQYSELIKSSTDEQGLPKQIEKPIDATPKSSGEIGEMERFMKEFMDQMASQRNDYLLEIEEIGWHGILDANRIKTDKTFVESKVIIKKAKDVVAKYTERTDDLIKYAKSKVRNLNISESSKRNMLSGIERGVNKAKANIDAIWSLEAKVINEYENIIFLLSANKKAWVVDDNQILFSNDRDLEQFNSYISSIQQIAQQQVIIQRQSVQAVNQKIDRMNKRLDNHTSD